LLRQKSKKIHKGVFCSELVAKCYKVRGERGDGEREREKVASEGGCSFESGKPPAKEG